MSRLLPIVLTLLLSAGCTDGTRDPRVEQDQVQDPVLERAEGLASYYASALNGRTTASGIPLDLSRMVAAHPRYPFGTVVRVTSLENQQSVDVDIVDRGPAAGPRQDGVLIDLSRAAAQKLGFIADGRARVRLEVLRWGTGQRGSSPARAD